MRDVCLEVQPTQEVEMLHGFGTVCLQQTVKTIENFQIFCFETRMKSTKAQ